MGAHATFEPTLLPVEGCDSAIRMSQADATLLDVLIDGFEKNEIIHDFHWRDLPMPTEEAAVERFGALTAEARRWKGRPVVSEQVEELRREAWPDLEIRQAGRGIRVSVRPPRFYEWWHRAETWAGDPMGPVGWPESSPEASDSAPDPEPRSQELLVAIRARLPELSDLLRRADGHWEAEDCFYRFYHQSFKVYTLQHTTREIVDALAAIAPDRELNSWFMEVVREGTGKSFALEHNKDWLRHTRPIVEAFFHARYFLELVVRYGRELTIAPRSLPSGWAAVLYLYGLR